MMNANKKHQLIRQIMILFSIGVLITGISTFFVQRSLSDASIKEQIENLASGIAGETAVAIREHPAYQWLLSYWYTHAEEMEIEYDVGYESGTATEEKCRRMNERYPGIVLNYVTPEELDSMPPEDQRLFAEIAYSWLITRMNEIKRTYHVDYLFCVVSDETYQTQFFLLSAADPGAVRGKNYEEVYPLGNMVTVAASQQEAMRNAEAYSSHLADAGNYVDYYIWLEEVQGHPAFIGMTYNLSDIHASMNVQTRRETLFAMVHQVILSMVCLLCTYQFVLLPLGKVQSNIRLYKQTKDSKTVTENLRAIRARNEIGELSNDVSDLAREMDDYINRIETITAEKQRISTELSVATQIQAAMLPHVFPPFPDRTDIDIYASMDPAKEVGGDFYDYFLIDEDHLGLVIADVSGKGVPAALFMMASKIILQSVAMLGRSPGEILTKTNDAICSNNEAQMFVTVWLGILELSSGKLTCANAGHECPALKRKDGGYELYKDHHGFVIGGLEGMRYDEYVIQLEPGTKLFVYTDGVPEATNAQNELFGTDRMISALNDRPDAAPQDVLINMRQAVDRFVKDAEQFDDLTMLCLEYKGPQAKRSNSQ